MRLWETRLWKKYHSEIVYVFVGGLTTLVNFIVYFLMERVFHIYYLTANVLAWIAAVLFAYVANRKWVFSSVNSNIGKELLSFTVSRLFSGGVELLLLYLMVDLGHLDNGIAKVLVAVLTVILNYITGKFLVFKKSPNKKTRGK